MRLDPEPASSSLVALRDVARVYPRGASAVVALDGVSLEVRRGEKLAIMGPSGSGKTTLLSILGCLDRPSRGEYLFEGRSVESLGDDELSRLRNRSIGFVFQSFHLIPQLTVAENVETPLLYEGGRPRSGAGARSKRSRGSAWPTAPTTGRPSCRGARRSGRPSRAPSSPGRASSSPTSPPATSTPTPGRRSPASSTSCTRGAARWSS